MPEGDHGNRETKSELPGGNGGKGDAHMTTRGHMHGESVAPSDSVDVSRPHTKSTIPRQQDSLLLQVSMEGINQWRRAAAYLTEGTNQRSENDPAPGCQPNSARPQRTTVQENIITWPPVARGSEDFGVVEPADCDFVLHVTGWLPCRGRKCPFRRSSKSCVGRSTFIKRSRLSSA